MDGPEKLRVLAARLNRQPEHVLQNDTVRNALVLSFIHALGYNIFDRNEVVPKYSADRRGRSIPADGPVPNGAGTNASAHIEPDGYGWGAKRWEATGADSSGVGTDAGHEGTRSSEAGGTALGSLDDDDDAVDYAILQNGHPVMVVDCGGSRMFPKRFGELQPVVAICTDGVVYSVYSDIERPRRMDPAPFLEIDLRNLDAAPWSALMKLSREQFDPDVIWEVAKEHRYVREIRRVLAEQIRDPADDFVKFFACRMCPLVVRRKDREAFTRIVRSALQDVMADHTARSDPAPLRELEPAVRR